MLAGAAKPEGPDAPDTATRKHGLKEKLVDETRRLSVMAVYMWAVLVLLLVHKRVVLRQYGLSSEIEYKAGFALFNALLLAKFMLVADAMHVGESLREKPVFYLIAFKSAMYAAVLIVFNFIEEVLVGMVHGGTFVESIPSLGGGGVEGILLVGVIAFVALLPFFAYREIRLAMGEGELRSLMLRPRTKSDAHPIRKAS